jgi:hypothetical protein
MTLEDEDGETDKNIFKRKKKHKPVVLEPFNVLDTFYLFKQGNYQFKDKEGPSFISLETK